jgi:hypothetical protein
VRLEVEHPRGGEAPKPVQRQVEGRLAGEERAERLDRIAKLGQRRQRVGEGDVGRNLRRQSRQLAPPPIADQRLQPVERKDEAAAMLH